GRSRGVGRGEPARAARTGVDRRARARPETRRKRFRTVGVAGDLWRRGVGSFDGQGDGMTTQRFELDGEALRDSVAEVLVRARDRSVTLTDSVDDDDLVRQHSPLMSPLVWDLAHVGNQEELWLVRDVGGREPIRCDIDELYDAFQHPRAER